MELKIEIKEVLVLIFLVIILTLSVMDYKSDTRCSRIVEKQPIIHESPLEIKINTSESDIIRLNGRQIKG